MWAATHDGGGPYHSHSPVQHPVKLWTETVSRLWRLRRQHWYQNSLLNPHSQDHQYSQQPSQHHHPQHKDEDHSHQQHPHAHPHPPSQPLYHSQSSWQHTLAHPKSSRHRNSHHHYGLPHQYDNQRLQGKTCLRGDLQPPLCPVDSRLPHQFLANKHTHRIFSPTVPHKASKDGLQNPYCAKPVQSASRDGLQSRNRAKPVQSASRDGLQSRSCAKLVQSAAALVQQECKDQGIVQKQKGMKRSSSGWIEEVLPVPSGLVKQSDSKALCRMVNKHVESYIHEIKQKTSTAECKDYDLLKPSPIVHAGSLYHFKPPNLGQRDFEEWVKKHRRKKLPKSVCSGNIAFGRSISSQRRKSATSATKTEAKNDTSFIKCMRGKLNARREVLKAIQDYHINAEARAQLEKRASEFEQEKKERQRKKAVSTKQADMEQRSRQSSVVNTLFK
ncbi:hypothetical protein GOP47_0028096 [Adiantum capillus-veneris]|nr:hypothetical protein GOP47_0028096 [Adiantum capillus-veneris]